MAVFSAYNILRVITAFHFTLSYVLLTDPSKLINHSMVRILGESMGFPPISATTFTNSPLTTPIIGALFGIIALSDLASLGTSDALRIHWGIQAPTRLAAFMALSGYTYLRKPSSPGRRFVPLTAEEEVSSGISTGLVFAWAFLEMCTWFMIYIKLREESGEVQLRLMEQERAKQEWEERKKLEEHD